MTFTLDPPPVARADDSAAAVGVTNHPDSLEILRTLVIETQDPGDAATLARVVSAMVNDTKVYLASMTVSDTAVYPVAGHELPDHDHRELRFRLRDNSLVLDGLLTEQIVTIVASVAPVKSINYVL